MISEQPKPPANRSNGPRPNGNARAQGRSGSWNDPAVAEIAARALIKNNLNATAAAKEIRSHLNSKSAMDAGKRMMDSPAVREELEKQLAPRGLDQKSSDRYVNILWAWLEGSDKDKAQTAARILGRAFVREEPDQAPVELRIAGIEEFKRRMLSAEDDDNDEAIAPENGSRSDAASRAELLPPPRPKAVTPLRRNPNHTPHSAAPSFQRLRERMLSADDDPNDTGLAPESA